MQKYRQALPQMQNAFFLTDGGIETTLIFLEGQDLPFFAAFHLLGTESGESTLKRYFRTYAQLAQKHQCGLVLETATWRASADWGDKLGYSRDALAEANRKSVQLLEEIRSEYETPGTPIIISGCIGPRGDGYIPGDKMSAKQAERYHAVQIEAFANTAADLATAITMNYADEAIGLALAARNAALPVVISFTLETDGKLPTGQPLGDAIQQVDDATSGYPAYFMINCAHPSHFSSAVSQDEPWKQRIRGLRANASTLSHAELNDATTLDIGNPVALAQDYAGLKRQALKSLNVFGGCCGTDHRHVEQIALACMPLHAEAASGLTAGKRP
jgi:S-methylmethionine-dependent homocysteine/selenocysteine methylase